MMGLLGGNPTVSQEASVFICAKILFRPFLCFLSLRLTFHFGLVLFS